MKTPVVAEEEYGDADQMTNQNDVDTIRKSYQNFNGVSNASSKQGSNTSSSMHGPNGDKSNPLPKGIMQAENMANAEIILLKPSHSRNISGNSNTVQNISSIKRNDLAVTNEYAQNSEYGGQKINKNMIIQN